MAYGDVAAGGEDGRVHRGVGADRGDRDTGRHLRGHEEGLLAAHLIGGDGHADHGEDRLRGDEAREVRGGAGAGDYRFNAVAAEEMNKVTAGMSLPGMPGL